MEFNQDNGSASYRIKAYHSGAPGESGYITVNDGQSDQQYHCPILIMPEKLIAPWNVANFLALRQQDFAAILALKPQVVIIGRGIEENEFLSSDLFQPLTEQGIGVEIMSSISACRTYTLLMAEGRNVLAGIFV